jgi:hypothetical protein
MKRNIQKLTDNKLMLTTVIKENNEELKEMEKLLTEKKTECEKQRMQNNTGKLESLDLMCKEQDATISSIIFELRIFDSELFLGFCSSVVFFNTDSILFSSSVFSLMADSSSNYDRGNGTS